MRKNDPLKFGAEVKMELKEAIAQGNKYLDDFPPPELAEILRTLINLAQTVLQVSEAEGMPRKIHKTAILGGVDFACDPPLCCKVCNPTKIGNGYCSKHSTSGEAYLENIAIKYIKDAVEEQSFNSALDLCTAYIAGKLERSNYELAEKLYYMAVEYEKSGKIFKVKDQSKHLKKCKRKELEHLPKPPQND